MKLTPREKDKLLISLAANVAKNRLSTLFKNLFPTIIIVATAELLFKVEKLFKYFFSNKLVFITSV